MPTVSDPFWIKQGDTKKNLVRTLKNADGTVINLTGATVVFTMRKGSRAATIDEVECGIPDEPNGVVEYAWRAGDTDDAGVYDAEFEVTLPGSEIITVPNDGHMKVTITPELA